MKKFFAILLSVAMILTLCTVAFAAKGDDDTVATTGDTTENQITKAADSLTGSGTIEIEGAAYKHIYHGYRIFDLVMSPDKNAYSYTVNPKWEAFFYNKNPDDTINKDSQTDATKNYFTVDKAGNATIKPGIADSSADIKAFAKLALEYATDNSIGESWKVIVKDGKVNETLGDLNKTTTIKVTDLPLGYYLIDSTLGTLLMLDTTNPTIDILEKNGLPRIEKYTKNPDSPITQWGDESTACIGKPIEFRIVVATEEGAEGYIIHDKMSAGFDFVPYKAGEYAITNLKDKDNNNVKIEIKSGEEIGVIYADDDGYKILRETTDYKFEWKVNDDGTIDLSITFMQNFLNTVVDNGNIGVYYKAMLNGNAIIGEAGNPNEAYLQYSNDYYLDKKTTNTTTWPFNLFKHSPRGSNGEVTPLAGAEFKLYINQNKSTEVNFYVDETESTTTIKINGVDITVPLYKVCMHESSITDHVCDESNHTHVKSITTGDNGYFRVEGLTLGRTYYLEEVKAPDGYNLLSSLQQVTISNSDNFTVDVENKTGSELPSTGGIGTTIFYIVGGLLMVGSVVLLVTKKKMSVNDD